MKKRETMLPVLRPVGDQDDIDAVAEVIESGWWGKGPKVAQFEKEFAEMVGAKYAVAITSNSHGQDLIMKALGITEGNIINPTISFMATAMIPLWNGCSTNVVDVRSSDLNMDPEKVAKAVNEDTKMLIAVNMAGVPAPIDEYRKVFDGFILEDCAHSCYVPGAGLKGDAAVWSFQAVKTMPSGDGGMITTDDEELYEKLKKMTWFGVSSTYSRVNKNDDVSGKPGYTWDYEVDTIGQKCYMIDLTAALCLSQMKKLDGHLERRRQIQQAYNERLVDIVERPPHSHTVQYYCARVPAHDRDNLIDYLADKNIHTSVHFKPLHKYEVIENNLTRKNDYSVAEREWERLISLPVHPAMTNEDIDYVIYWVNKYFMDKYND